TPNKLRRSRTLSDFNLVRRDRAEPPARQAVDQTLLRVGDGLAGRGRAPDVSAVALEVARPRVVREHGLEDLQTNLCAGLLVEDRHHELDAPEEVARHPVGARDVDLLLVPRAEREGAAVLEEPPDDRADADRVRDARDPGPQTADPAHGERDRDPGLG